jgi:sporulation protein YlmC with PRC-barrel domain
MRPNELTKKNVISKKAKHIGTVTGIEIDASTWRVTHLQLALIDQLLQNFGLTIKKQPSLRQVEILLPTDTVEIVSDFIVLNKTIEELKEIIETK